MKIRELLKEAEAPVNWVVPSDNDLRQEYDYEYALPKRRWDERAKIIGAQHPIFISPEDLIEKVKRAKAVRIPHDDYDSIHNVTSLRSLKDIQRMTDSYSYPRDVPRIAKGFQDNAPMPLPIIIKGKRGRWILSGNTRLNVAKVLGYEAKALEVDAS